MNNYQKISNPSVEDLIKNNYELSEKNCVAPAWKSSINY